MFTAKSFLSLDLGAGTLKLAEFTTTDTGGLLLTRFALQRLGPEALQESKRERAMQTALRDLLASQPLSTRRANICAPASQVFSKFVKLPPVDSAKLSQIVQYEAQQNIPFPLAEAVWDFQIMGAAASGETEVLLVAAKSDTVEALFRATDAAGLKTEIVDAAPAALCNAFRYNYGDIDGCTLLLDIGAKTTNLLFFERGKFFSRTINIGANSITQEFAAESKLTFANAEQIKIDEGFVSLGGAYEEPDNARQAAVAKIARQAMTRLHLQINQTVQFYRGQQGGSAPTRLLLAGGASIMPYTAQFFSEKLNIAVEYFNPFRNVQIDPAIDLDALAKVAHSFGEVVGLGLRNLAQCPVELNLIPKSIRQKQLFNQKKPYFAATFASVALVVFGVGIFFNQITNIKRASLAELNASLIPLQQRAQELDENLKHIQNSQNELDTYTGHLRDRFFWPEALVEMRNLLLGVEEKLATPGQDVGVWIENLGAVYIEDEPEETPANNGPFGGMDIYFKDPELLRRHFPHIYEIMRAAGTLPKPGAFSSPTIFASKPALNTNLVTLNLKLRAVNLNKPSDPAANGRLAFAVAEAFKNSEYFDSAGTKLADDLEEPDSATFRFGMTLKLKSDLRL